MCNIEDHISKEVNSNGKSFVLIFNCNIKLDILDIVGDMLDQELLSTDLAGVSDESERIKVMISGVNTQEADTDWGH